MRSRCKYCFTELRTLHNCQIETCSKCQASYKRKSRFTLVQKQIQDGTNPVIKINQPTYQSTGIDAIDECLKEATEKRVKAVEASRKLIEKFEAEREWLNNL